MSDKEVKTKTKARQFSEADFDKVAEYIVEEHRRRKKNRKDNEKAWKEIDRQLRMEPEVKYKRNPDGSPISHKAWMPEIELPNQAEALEILCADALRMLFPDSGDFYRIKADAPDQFLAMFKDSTALVVNSEVDPPSMVTQTNVDDYARGWLNHILRQFDHRKSWDLINADSFKYGNGVGRVRMAKKPVFVHQVTGTFDKTAEIPIIAPVSIKNTFLDENEFSYMASGAVMGPAVIFHQHKKLADVQVDMKSGNSDAEDEISGGWIKDSMKGVEADKNGCIELLEFEGDLVIPEAGEFESTYVPGVICTVVIGKDGSKGVAKLVRLRFRKLATSSYIAVPYHQESIDNVYATSPLMKGLPIQRCASEAMNRFMQSAILNTEPVIKYSRDDQYFKAKGGPKVFPGATWATDGDVEVMQIGNPVALQAAYTALQAQYADVTGINAARLGSQTVSHTTAYAKDQEIERGTVRTVDYSRSIIHGPMTRWLNMCYELSRKSLGDKTEQVYMDSYGAFLNVSQQMLPEKVFIEVYGSSGPSDSAAKQQKRTAALLTVVQLNNVAVQMGLAQPLNYDAMQRELLKEAGITDVDIFTSVPQGNPANPGMAGIGGGGQASNALPIALQGLQGVI